MNNYTESTLSASRNREVAAKFTPRPVVALTAVEVCRAIDSAGAALGVVELVLPGRGDGDRWKRWRFRRDGDRVELRRWGRLADLELRGSSWSRGCQDLACMCQCVLGDVSRSTLVFFLDGGDGPRCGACVAREFEHQRLYLVPTQVLVWAQAAFVTLDGDRVVLGSAFADRQEQWRPAIAIVGEKA